MKYFDQVGEKNHVFNVDLELIRILKIIVLSIVLMIVEISSSTNYAYYSYWRPGSVIGLVLSILCLVAALSRLTMRYYDVSSIQLTSSGPSNAVSEVCHGILHRAAQGCIGLASRDNCTNLILSNRIIYYFLILVVSVLATTVMAEEFILIKNWNCNLYAGGSRWLDGPFGWGYVSCNCEYWAGISAACVAVTLSLVFAAVKKPILPVVLVSGVLSFAYGMYMALLSSYTIQSLMVMGNITKEMSDKLPFDTTFNRFLHLMPIQFIALVMVIIGLAFVSHCFALEPKEGGSRILKWLMVLLMSAIAALNIANIIFTQINITNKMRQHWNGNYIDWTYWLSYLLYASSEISMSLFQVTVIMYKIINRNMVTGGMLAWCAGLLQLALSVFCLYTIFHAVVPPSQPIAGFVIMNETPAWLLGMNVACVIFTLGAGLYNFIRHGIAMLQFCMWIGALVLAPFACLGLLSHQVVKGGLCRRLSNAGDLRYSDIQNDI